MVNWVSKKPTGALVLNDGTIFKGFGFGAIGRSSGEVSWRTNKTGPCFAASTARSAFIQILPDATRSSAKKKTAKLTNDQR